MVQITCRSNVEVGSWSLRFVETIEPIVKQPLNPRQHPEGCVVVLRCLWPGVEFSPAGDCQDLDWVALMVEEEKKIEWSSADYNAAQFCCLALVWAKFLMCKHLIKLLKNNVIHMQINVVLKSWWNRGCRLYVTLFGR